MKLFPNLLWAVGDGRVRHFELAEAAAMSESQFSRALNGRMDFSHEQRDKVARFLGYPANWLFKQVRPPRGRSKKSRVETVGSRNL